MLSFLGSTPTLPLPLALPFPIVEKQACEKRFLQKLYYHNLLEAPSGSCPPAEYMYLTLMTLEILWFSFRHAFNACTYTSVTKLPRNCLAFSISITAE